MKKKIISLFLIMIFVFILPTTLAEDEDDVTEPITKEEQEEIKIAPMPFGARVRTLQLQKSVKIKILKAEQVIDFINEKGNETNTDNLDSILSELKLLEQELENLNASTEEKASEDWAAQYVDLRHEAINLVKEFRDELHDNFIGTIITQDELQELKQTLKEETREEIKAITDEIQQTKRRYNAMRLKNFLNRLGTPNQELINQIENGELEVKDIKQRIRSSLRKVPIEARKERLETVRDNLQEQQKIRERIHQRVNSNLATIQQQRLQNRLENINNLENKNADIIKQRINKRLNLNNKVQNRLDSQTPTTDVIDNLEVPTDTSADNTNSEPGSTTDQNTGTAQGQSA